MKPIKVKASDFMRTLTLDTRVHVTGSWRVKIGLFLVRLGVLVAGVRSNIIVEKSE